MYRIPESQETVGQWAVKEGFAAQAKKDVDYVLRRGLAALADYIYDPQGTLLVFNPLSWQRSGLVEMDLDKGLELVDQVTEPDGSLRSPLHRAGLPARSLPRSECAVGGIQGLRAERNQSTSRRLRRR